MKFLKGIFWALVVSVMLWAVVIVSAHGILGEMNLRDLKYENKRKWIQILEDRALAERYADPAYQDYRTAVHRKAK